MSIATLTPTHAIVRDNINHQTFKCLCGHQPATTNPDQARAQLARHILDRQEQP